MRRTKTPRGKWVRGIACLVLASSATARTEAIEWLPLTPDDLQMKSEPKAPAAPAIYLYRQVDRDDTEGEEDIYYRIRS